MFSPSSPPSGLHGLDDARRAAGPGGRLTALWDLCLEPLSLLRTQDTPAGGPGEGSFGLDGCHVELSPGPGCSWLSQLPWTLGHPPSASGSPGPGPRLQLALLSGPTVHLTRLPLAPSGGRLSSDGRNVAPWPQRVRRCPSPSSGGGGSWRDWAAPSSPSWMASPLLPLSLLAQRQCDFPSAQDAGSLGAALPGAMLSAGPAPDCSSENNGRFGRDGELMKGAFLRCLRALWPPRPPAGDELREMNWGFFLREWVLPGSEWAPCERHPRKAGWRAGSPGWVVRTAFAWTHQLTYLGKYSFCVLK